VGGGGGYFEGIEAVNTWGKYLMFNDERSKLRGQTSYIQMSSF
jgi:hypothetical protein